MNDLQPPTAEAARGDDAGRFESVLLNLPTVAVQAYEPDGTITFWSKGSERVYGYGAEEAIGREVAALLLGPVTAAAERAGRARAIATGDLPPACALEAVHKDGSRISIHSCRMLRPRPGRPPEFICYDIETTHWSRAGEETLRQNRELTALNELGQALHRLADPAEIANLVFSKFSGLLDDRNLYIALYDAAAGEVFFPVYTIHGRRREPFSRKLGKGLTEHIIETRAPLLLNANTAILAERLGLNLIGQPCLSFLGVPMASGDQVEGVIALQDYEKEQAYTHNDLRLLTTIAAQAASALCSARLFAQARRELAERRRVEDALRQSRVDLERAQAVGHVGSWISEAGPTLSLQWSAETCRIFGITPASFDGRPESFFRMVHPDDLEAVRTAREKAFRGEAHYDIQHRIVRPDGAVRWVQQTAEVECDAARRLLRMVGVVQDITERRLLEDQLRQSQKLESIGQLAAGVAHDFNNILTVITGNATLLQNDLVHQPEHAALVAEVLTASERAANLTRQLLLFSRKQQMQPQAIDLNQLTSNLTKMLSRMLGEDIALEFRYATDLPLVTADPGMIELAIMNLAVNSRDAMPRGGRLHIATSTLAVSAEAALLNPQARPGRFVCLAVSDSGLGISPAVRDHVFEPFFTTKEVGKGTGLGLATVYGIVQQHRGWIELQTELNVGTTFRICLPVSPITEGEREAQAATEIEPGHGETILFVEDEAPVRTLIHRILTRHGYQVIVASSGAAARRLPLNEIRRADLLLTDMVMPGGVNGHELAQALRRLHPALRIIYYSGYSVEMTMGRIGLEEGDTFLQKPCTPHQLLRAVAASLHG